MKKRITQKVMATVAVACLMIGGVFAQTHDGSAIPGSGANFANNWADQTTQAHMIEGTTIPMFVMPDNYFHPNYDPTAAVPVRTLTDDFTWTWSVTAGTAANISFGINNAQDNYTTVTTVADADGIYTIHAVEVAPAAWGGCSGAGRDVILNVYNTPAAVISVNGTEVEGCAGDPVMPTAVTATISGGWQNYWLAWTLEIKTLDNLGADDDFYQTDKSTTIGAAPYLAVNRPISDPVKTLVSGANDITTVGGAVPFSTINNQTTVYTYTLTNINDQALRFTNFIGMNGAESANEEDFAYNALAAQTVEITVHPTPVTGPIYHINNTWAD